MNLPQILVDCLRNLEPGAEFTGNLPKIRSSSGKIYFCKLGQPSDEEQYVGEVESLKAIQIAAPGLAPSVLRYGVTNGQPFFISEYKELASLTEQTSVTLAKRLTTELHAYKSPKGFGFAVPTYCGATRLKNGWFESWDKCYSAMITDLLTQLRKRGGYSDLCNKGDAVVKDVIPKLLGPLVIEPVLLHGDLWSGNAGTDSNTGQSVIFDPSSFFGHNEADLAIARIFGGFSRKFFTTYHDHFPKTDPVGQYELRADLYELFHYLNHAVLFGGGGYASSASKKMDTLLSAKL